MRWYSIHQVSGSFGHTASATRWAHPRFLQKNPTTRSMRQDPQWTRRNPRDRTPHSRNEGNARSTKTRHLRTSRFLTINAEGFMHQSPENDQRWAISRYPRERDEGALPEHEGLLLSAELIERKPLALVKASASVVAWGVKPISKGHPLPAAKFASTVSPFPFPIKP